MGVKSLWTLLTPVGRPVMLETVEGKVMAIDSSIWLYQFQATMRDKEGRALVNAHVLGFLRRISKLLFFGIKPVFVFDGGAPALKRSTLNERKKKKSGAASTHTKLAEKILAAQMRREALNQAQSNQANSKKSKGKGRQSGDILLDENTVFLEDIDGSTPKTPVKRKPPTPSSSSMKKNKFHDHDPYKLPEVDMEEAINKVTRSTAPDPRLATEDELRDFIEQMRPEDFDINSPEFRELPTEVQYEIIGDLRLKSRQTSYARLQRMLRSAPTPLDFSKQQINNLRQRNALTQQLLMTTDSIGNANIAIPIRIASERNREYVLMKNEGVDGGWILGIKDTGTREKPIVIDHEETIPEEGEEEDSDADMEEVEVPIRPAPDADLREYQRDMVLAGISQRSRSTVKPIERKKKSAPLQAHYSESSHSPLQEYDDDDMLAYAIQESLDQSNSKIDSSLNKARPPTRSLLQQRDISPEDDDDFYVDHTPRTRLETALSFANASSNRLHETPSEKNDVNSIFGIPTLLSSTNDSPPMSGTTSDDDGMEEIISSNVKGDDEDFGPLNEPKIPSFTDEPHQRDTNMPQISEIPSTTFGQPTLLSSGMHPDLKHDKAHNTMSGQPTFLSSTHIGSALQNGEAPNATFGKAVLLSSSPGIILPKSDSASGDNIDQIPPHHETELKTPLSTGHQDQHEASEVAERITSPLNSPVTFVQSIDAVDTAKKVSLTIIESDEGEDEGEEMEEIPVEAPFDSPSTPKRTIQGHTASVSPHSVSPQLEEEHPIPSAESINQPPQINFSDSEEEQLFAWSRTPSPMHEGGVEPPLPSSPTHWDAAEEMDVNAEEGEFARFISQVKGKNMDDVRKEIDAEITGLNQQRKNAIRDSEDITQQMIAQIMTMLRLFGIPYMTAPMEAEAQCAELVSLELVDGVITDDSDVFLFGAKRVYKNMFNQSKTVECFLLTDLSRELGLDRDTLIQLAYLLGSDYTEGLPGVGPVVAMELLKEFPGHSGLHKFKDWWKKVQSGKDREEDSQSKFRKQFKKKFKNLYLAPDWPNSVVRDAYYHPTVDSSEEPFKWGMPDLDGLRAFFRQELGWNQSKVDELLLPIIQRMNKRNQTAALNKQGNLNEFLDLSAGSGTHAPRQSRAYQSKRLQQVISDFRKRRKSSSAAPSSRSGSKIPSPEDKNDMSNGSDNEPPSKKQKTKTVTSSIKGKAKSTAPTSKTRHTKAATSARRPKGRGGGGARAKKARTPDVSDDDDSAASENAASPFIPADDDDAAVRQAALNLRPRPRPRPIPKGVRTAESTLLPTNVNEGQASQSTSAA